ncbi:protein of unknown function [Planctomicrobium piriforme]|uniref:DUF4062 domain-containing protein n=2 Tax=Planctomicrobium piriforme TaxID=1576369 RepID=A0A1I3FW80_9PLAN|nr:protein of unknown function [Planctomicrobium piriforme]
MTDSPPSSRKPIIMVSSAVYGIEELLEVVFGILNTAGFTVWMSHKGTVPVDPRKSNFENCLEAVRACDLFLGILTTSYGSGKDGDGLSITHQEVLEALKIDKPRWFLAHHDLIFARGLLRDFGYRTTAARAGLTLQGKKLVEDLRVIDMYEAVIQAEKKLADRKGNWAQPFATDDDAKIFVVSQFLRYGEAAEFVRQQPLAFLKQSPAGERQGGE